MKILHITINPIALERRILNQARTTHDVRILALKNADSDKKKSISPVILTELSTIFHHGGPLKFLHYNLKVANSGRKIDTDLIHAHDLWVLPAAVLLAKIKKIPLIYDAHEFYNGLEIFIRRKIRRFIWLQVEKWCIPKIDYLITVSEPLAQLYRDRFNPGCPVQVIRNLPVFETVSLEKQMPLIRREGERLILFHGHFRPGRGLMSLISALAKIPHCRLALIGGGEMSDELKALARETGVIDRVDFYDYISTDRLISTACTG